MIRKIIIYCLFQFSLLSVVLGNSYYANLDRDTLRIGNGLIERKFSWNGGNVITHSVVNKQTKQEWKNNNKRPDFYIARNTPKALNSSFRVMEVKANVVHPSYLEVMIEYTLDSLEVRRLYRVYDEAPAIVCNTFLRGKTSSVFGARAENLADKKNIEFTEDMKSKQVDAILDQFKPDGLHWQMKVVEFQDVTDWNNNLVFETNIIPYRKNAYRGNLLFASDNAKGGGFFFLKEAPCSNVQLAYNGHDFTAEFGHFTVTGLGVTERDLDSEEWIRTYGVVLGVSAGDELHQLQALRSYQKNIRILNPERDEMVMMNTWGDRSQDSKVNEQFCLREVECAARLGMTHFQIDDGWQVGKSPNSAVAKGSFKNIWDNPNYWEPDPVKYPRGLIPIVEKGRDLGVEICLWFNPSVQHDYADWEKDAQAMIKLYRECGIRVFKIDGLAIPNKQSETNLRKLFDEVLAATADSVLFNLDATAGRRAGYHMFNEYGNIFLENRYSDWQNYYPYHTLRNLWQLSKFVPAEKLQIEFLNKWRNAEKYKGDPFAPSAYSFEYLFAITMAAQPLAWFEGTGLPEEAFPISKLISEYKQVQHDFHTGMILPIGEEPSGRSWTGFQSIKRNSGYLIVFRENNSQSITQLETWLPEGAKIKCTPILGNGKKMRTTVGYKGTIEVELTSINDFVMYRYEVIGGKPSR